MRGIIDWQSALAEYAAVNGLVVGITGVSPLDLGRQGLALRDQQGWNTPFVSYSAEARYSPLYTMSSARSMIAIAVPYPPCPPGANVLNGQPGGKIARYAWGSDYHRECWQQLVGLEQLVQRLAGRTIVSQIMVDTGPLMDRAVAHQAGIGWWAQNASIMTPQYGSYVALGQMVLDFDLEKALTRPMQTRCGDCRRCLSACPTGALTAPYLIDPSRCLSYVTQVKGFIPRELRALLGDRLYGCDTCQSVCPHNPAVGEPPLLPLLPLLQLNSRQFKERWGSTAMGWSGITVFQRNALVALGNSGDPEAVWGLSQVLSADTRPVLRGHAAWALGQLGGRVAEDALLRAQSHEQSTEVQSEIKLALAEL